MDFHGQVMEKVRSLLIGKGQMRNLKHGIDLFLV